MTETWAGLGKNAGIYGHLTADVTASPLRNTMRRDIDEFSRKMGRADCRTAGDCRDDP
jgi:hypothetical protein